MTTNVIHTIESESLETTDLTQVEESLAKLHDSPLAAQLQVLVRQLRQGTDVTYLSDEDLLSPANVAELLQISRPMVVALIKRGELEDKPVGTHHRVPAAEVMAYIERRDRAARDVAESFARSGRAVERIVVRNSGVDTGVAARLGF